MIEPDLFQPYFTSFLWGFWLLAERMYAMHDVKNLQGRSVRLDIIAIDGNGRVYFIEI